MGKLTEYIRENTDMTDPVTIECLKESGIYDETDEALFHAIERGDDEEARELAFQLGLDDVLADFDREPF